MTLRVFASAFFLVILLGRLSAQPSKNNENSFFISKVQRAPESVFDKFFEAGMQPTNHELTAAEQVKLEKAFSILPALYKKVLKDHLSSISFMDNMPNTALTSPVQTTDSIRHFNITFRAGIFNETISEWATRKEKSAFNNLANENMEIQIDAGKLDAIQYVLLHEATHVVDAVLGLTFPGDVTDSLVMPTAFTKDIWRLFNKPTEQFTNPILEEVRFRSGKVQPITSAPAVYQALKQTPFSSLYAMASCYEDAAELITIYHLTQKLNQRFLILVRDSGRVLARFEPMKNKLVKQRIRKLHFLYS